MTDQAEPRTVSIYALTDDGVATLADKVELRPWSEIPEGHGCPNKDRRQVMWLNVPEADCNYCRARNV